MTGGTIVVAALQPYGSGFNPELMFLSLVSVHVGFSRIADFLPPPKNNKLEIGDSKGE